MQRLPMSGRRQGGIQPGMVDYLAQRVRRLGSRRLSWALQPLLAREPLMAVSSGYRGAAARPVPSNSMEGPSVVMIELRDMRWAVVASQHRSLRGSCHCGSIRFEGEVDPAKVVVCRCMDCQTLLGSAFRTVVAER